MNLFSRRNLIKPFNLDQEECREMFNAALPEKVMVTISVLSSRDLTEECTQEIYSDIYEPLAALTSDCCRQAEHFGVSSRLFFQRHFDRDFPSALIPPAPLQEEWIWRDMYVQVSFHRCIWFGSFVIALGTEMAMTLYDLGVATTNSLNPADHEPIQAFPRSACHYRQAVNGAYKKHLGIWTEELVPYRNMIMVKVRALLAGLDPDREYDRFIQAGGKYCLEYPTLCP